MEHLDRKEPVKLREGIATTPPGLNARNQPAVQTATDAAMVSGDPELTS